jgi:hypothetical protein
MLAEVEARVGLCRPCWEDIVYRGVPMPSPRIVRRFD